MCELLQLFKRLLAFANSKPPRLARRRQDEAEKEDDGGLPEHWRWHKKPLPDHWRWDEQEKR